MGETWAVLVTQHDYDEAEVFGPYRTLEKAQEVAALFHNTGAVEYRDPDEYSVTPIRMQKYGAHLG